MVVKTGMVNAFIVNNLLKCVRVCGKVTTHITLGRKFVVIGVLFYQLTNYALKIKEYYFTDYK
jgi:hypothetical protein